MATKKTPAKKQPVTPEETPAKKPAPETNKNSSIYRSGDITRLSIMALMLGVVFTLGLLLGLGLGAQTARKDVFRRIQNSQLTTSKPEESVEVEEAEPDVPTPQQETPAVNTLEDNEDLDTDTPEIDATSDLDPTVPSN